MARGGGTVVLLATSALVLAGAALWLVLQSSVEPPVGPVASTGEPEPGPAPRGTELEGTYDPSIWRQSSEAPVVRTEAHDFDAVAMEGTIRAENGRPVEGASVTLAGRRTATDARGWFRFDAIPPGEHGYLVAADGYFLVDRRVTIPGDRLDQRLRLVRSISGVLRDAAGTPLPGFTVRALRKGQQGPDAVTDTEGRFSIPGVSSGSFTIFVLPHKVEGVPYLPVWASRVSGGKQELELTAQAGGTISGVVVGPKGEAVGGAWVKAKTRGKNYARAYFHAVSDVAGRFEVIVPLDATYRLEVTTPTDGEAGWRYLAWSLKAKEYLPPGTHGQRIELAAGVAVTGRLVDERGARLPGVELDLFRSGSYGPGPVRAQAVTREDGTFRFGGLNPIEYTVRLRTGSPNSAGWVLTGSWAVKAGGAAAELRRVKAATISGHVVSPEGAPLRRYVKIRQAESGFKATTKTKKDGTFLIGGLPPGEFTILVRGRRAGSTQWTDIEKGTVRAGDEDVRLETHP